MGGRDADPGDRVGGDQAVIDGGGEEGRQRNQRRESGELVPLSEEFEDNSELAGGSNRRTAALPSKADPTAVEVRHRPRGVRSRTYGCARLRWAAKVTFCTGDSRPSAAIFLTSKTWRPGFSPR